MSLWYETRTIVLAVHAKVAYGPAMDHKELIEALGGHTALAAALGVDVNRVCQWKIRGIPSKRWHEVLALADAAAIEVTAIDLAYTKPLTSKTLSPGIFRTV